MIAIALVALACSIPHPLPAKDELDDNPRRQALWKALRVALPNDPIAVYCESPSLTDLIFRSKDKTLLFSLKEKKAKEVHLVKKPGKINCITFRKDQKGDCWWVFWLDGKEESSMPAEKAGAGTAEVENSNNEIQRKRAALWAALRKDFPNEHIDVYVENPSLTEIAFRSNRATMRFRLETGRAGRIEHMIGLTWINQMTFVERQNGNHCYVLWLDGGLELAMAAEK